MAVRYTSGQNLFSYFYQAIILVSFLSGNRMRLLTEKGQWTEVVRQIKTGKVTNNTSVEFCRAANELVQSMKPLFQQTNDVLEEQNDVD